MGHASAGNVRGQTSDTIAATTESATHGLHHTVLSNHAHAGADAGSHCGSTRHAHESVDAERITTLQHFRTEHADCGESQQRTQSRNQLVGERTTAGRGELQRQATNECCESAERTVQRSYHTQLAGVRRPVLQRLLRLLANRERLDKERDHEEQRHHYQHELRQDEDETQQSPDHKIGDASDKCSASTQRVNVVVAIHVVDGFLRTARDRGIILSVTKVRLAPSSGNVRHVETPSDCCGVTPVCVVLLVFIGSVVFLVDVGGTGEDYGTLFENRLADRSGLLDGFVFTAVLFRVHHAFATVGRFHIV